MAETITLEVARYSTERDVKPRFWPGSRACWDALAVMCCASLLLSCSADRSKPTEKAMVEQVAPLPPPQPDKFRVIGFLKTRKSEHPIPDKMVYVAEVRRHGKDLTHLLQVGSESRIANPQARTDKHGRFVIFLDRNWRNREFVVQVLDQPGYVAMGENPLTFKIEGGPPGDFDVGTILLD